MGFNMNGRLEKRYMISAIEWSCGLSRIGNGTWRQNETNEWNKIASSAVTAVIFTTLRTIVGSESINTIRRLPFQPIAMGISPIHLVLPPQMITCSVWGCSQRICTVVKTTDVPHNKARP